MGSICDKIFGSNPEPNENERYLKSLNKQDKWANLAKLELYLSNPRNDMSYYMPDQKFSHT